MRTLIFLVCLAARSDTVRMNIDDVWVTVHYAPNTSRQILCEGPDSSYENLYDDQERLDGFKTTIDGKTLTVHFDPGGRTVATDGMPELVVDFQGEHASSVHTRDGKNVATFAYDEKGYLKSSTVGDLTLALTEPSDDSVKETLSNGSGRTLRDTTVHNSRQRPQQRFAFDIVAKQLGLTSKRADDFVAVHSPGGIATRVRDRNGNVIAYFVPTVGLSFVAFDRDGKPLLYDIGVDDVRYMPPTNDFAVPDHIVYAADGRAGAYVRMPGDGAIASFWAERDRVVSSRTIKIIP